MSKHGRQPNIWIPATSLSLALLFSMAAALGVQSNWSAAVAAALVGLGILLWVRVARSIAEDRASVGTVLGACYELTVRISDARDMARLAGTEILENIDDVRDKCVGVTRMLAGLGSNPDQVGLADQAQPMEWNANPDVGGALEEVTSAIRDMAGILGDVDHNAKELITSTEETAYSMSRLDSFLQDMANSGRELESSTETANRVALEGTKVVEEMAKENEAIITAVKEAAGAVEDLGRWSQEVGKIVEVIRDIANETNLLALNAAIIAAQSGEHGKAFGVVAEEIRGLAERTSSSTKEISDLVKTVQKNVANVVQSMKRSLQRVERGELLARNAGTVLEQVFVSFESSRNMAKQIASSTFEHKIDSSHVVRSIQKVADIARRLESHQSGKWTTAGETLATARIVRALTKPKTSPVAVLESNARGLGGGALPAEASSSSRDLLVGKGASCEEILNAATRALENIHEKVAGWLDALNAIADLAKSAARQIEGDCQDYDSDRCWEITGCPEAVRKQCPVFQGDDKRCFLIDGVPASRMANDGTGTERRCADCAAFRNHIGILTKGIPESDR